MERSQKVEIILEAVDEAYSIPSYLEEDVREAIIKALVMIERKECQDKSKRPEGAAIPVRPIAKHLR